MHLDYGSRHIRKRLCSGMPVQACPHLLSYDVSHALAVRSRVRQLATIEQPKLCQCLARLWYCAALQPIAAKHGSAVVWFCLAHAILPDMTVAHSSRNLKLEVARNALQLLISSAAGLGASTLKPAVAKRCTSVRLCWCEGTCTPCGHSLKAVPGVLACAYEKHLMVVMQLLQT